MLGSDLLFIVNTSVHFSTDESIFEVLWMDGQALKHGCLSEDLGCHLVVCALGCQTLQLSDPLDCLEVFVAGHRSVEISVLERLLPLTDLVLDWDYVRCQVPSPVSKGSRRAFVTDRSALTSRRETTLLLLQACP